MSNPRFLRQMVFGILMLWACCLAWSTTQAEETDATAFKLIQGTVSAVNAHGIAVEHTRSDTGSAEMYLPFDSRLKLQGVASLKDLHEGDTVLVEYAETVVKGQAQEPPRVTRTAVRLSLVKRAPEPVPQSEMPESKDEIDEPAS